MKQFKDGIPNEYTSDLSAMSELKNYTTDKANIVISACGSGNDKDFNKDLFNFFDKGKGQHSLFLNGDNATMNVSEEGSSKWIPTFDLKLITNSNFEEGFIKISKNEKKEVKQEGLFNIEIGKNNPLLDGVIKSSKNKHTPSTNTGLKK
ncbi:MAG: hypothetical protein MUE72_10845 [Chitinophagaceae bacterium]|nr:hypothetical protein [Chitinophagaceae bacterium]